MDHVGGVAKVAARQEINRGVLFNNAKEVNDFLSTKFGDKKTPSHKFCKINVEDLMKERSKQSFTKQLLAPNHFMLCYSNQIQQAFSPLLVFAFTASA